MITLRFDCDLYAPEAITAASDTFASCAAIQRRSEANVEFVELTANPDFDEAAVAGEFANYVLGSTVDASHNRRSSP